MASNFPPSMSYGTRYETLILTCPDNCREPICIPGITELGGWSPAENDIGPFVDDCISPRCPDCDRPMQESWESTP